MLFSPLFQCGSKYSDGQRDRWTEEGRRQRDWRWDGRTEDGRRDGWTEDDDAYGLSIYSRKIWYKCSRATGEIEHGPTNMFWHYQFFNGREDQESVPHVSAMILFGNNCLHVFQMLQTPQHNCRHACWTSWILSRFQFSQYYACSKLFTFPSIPHFIYLSMP